MLAFRQLPIRRKLTLVFVLICCVALGLSLLAVVVYEFITFRDRALQRLEARARTIAVSLEGSLEFNDPRMGTEILQTLEQDKEVLAAATYTKEGRLFTRYVRPELKHFDFIAPQPDGARFHGKYLDLYQPIWSKGERTGSLYFRVDMRPAYWRVSQYALVFLFVVLAVLGCSILLSATLQRLISAPILKLGEAARLITRQKDYSLRVQKDSADEIGELTDAFNQMLETIATRDQALRDANQELESRGKALEHELTERKRVEAELKTSREELRKYANELEVRVAERTANLQETVRFLEGFCYSIAHDLRAPLRAMEGLATALLEDYDKTLDDTGKDYARRISASAKRMDTLIKDLLDFGRLSQLDIPLTTVDLKHEIDRVVALLHEEIRNKKAIVEVQSPLPSVSANPMMLEQVLCNLLGNALKFVEPGKNPKVKIWAERKDNNVRLWVKDSGIGIAPKYQEQIFRVFERLHNTTTYPGTGIGLAIVRKGLERMKGRVGVVSDVGQGSAFWIELQEAGERGSNDVRVNGNVSGVSPPISKPLELHLFQGLDAKNL